MNILLLDGHTVQALPIAKSLRKNGHTISALCEEKLSYGWFSRYLNYKFLCPSIQKDTIKYLDFLENHLKNNKYDVLIPLFDDSAELMSQYKERFNKYTNITIPSYDVFMHANDKNLTMKLANKINIPHPKTISLENNSLEEAALYCGFPSLIKPNTGAGARGIKRVDTIEELNLYYPEITKEFGKSTLQEFIPHTGDQYNCQMFRDSQGIIKAYTIQKKYRFYPISGGSISCSETIDIPQIFDQSKQILDNLKWIGIADFDYIQDPNDHKYKLIEINPRIPSSIKACVKANVDFAELIVQDIMGYQTNFYNTKLGVTMRNLSLDILWFLSSTNQERFTSKPSWFSFFGSKICYVDFSIDEPLASLVGFISGVNKFINPKFRKAKLQSNKKNKK